MQVQVQLSPLQKKSILNTITLDAVYTKNVQL